MSEKNNKKSWLKSALLWVVGVFINIPVFMFLRKGSKQHLVGIAVLGGLILSVGVGSYLVATCFFGWDYHSDLSPLYQQASNLLIGFMNTGKLSYLLVVILVGWLVNNTSRFLAKYQNKRKDKFETALELEANTRAALVLACNATCTVLVAIFWTSVMLLLYSKYVEVISGVDGVIKSMFYCVGGYIVLNIILELGLCYEVENLRKEYGRKPARVKVNNRRRTKKKVASGKNAPVINKQKVTIKN